MENELVSVIMPAYNAEKYISMSIISVMEQTYGYVELVIVDDGSTDNTAQIVSAAVSNWPDRIRFFVRKENGGTAAALNDAIELAEGKYICWLSADDMYCNDMVETELKYLKEKSKYDAVFSRCAYIDENNQFLRELAYNKALGECMEKNMAAIISTLMHGNFWHGCSVLAKAQCFKRDDRFNINYRASQDYDFWLRMAADYEIGYLNKVNVLSREHSEQGSRKINCNLDEIRVFFSILRREDLIVKLLKRMGLEYSFGNIKPYIQSRMERYQGMEEEMKLLEEELRKYSGLIEQGYIKFSR